MRAAVVERYGPPEVVRVVEVPRPTPRPREVLVRVHAAAVTSADARIRGARFPRGFAPFARLAFGIRRPRRRVLGSAFSGEVVAVGSKVDGLAPGDEVCGMAGLRMGAHAEHLAVAAKKVARKPAAVTHDDAAGVLFGGATALHYLTAKATVGPGTSVLVIGASGAVGTNAVQLARHLGATVTGMCSGANADLVRSLGAEQVIDRTAVALTDVDDRFDVVIDTVGVVDIPTGRRLLADDGVLLLVVADLADTIRARGNVRAGPSTERVEDVERLVGLVADGTLTVVLDEVLPLDAIADAHRRVDTGRKVGNIVVHP